MNGKFGTYRGLIRLLIANFMWLVGPYRQYGIVDFSRVKRLVFVCQGNICRSPFGHYIARKTIDGIPVASIGLSTTTGLDAFDMAIDVARDYAIDMSTHKTTDIGDFDIRDGDLFLVMEDRHIEPLLSATLGRDVQIGLLGLWCRPRLALLYDPHRLSRSYFAACYGRIREAVTRIGAELARSRQQH